MKLAFLFPGQGSQAIGMLSALAVTSPLVEQTFSEASEALGYDLWRVVQDGPDEELNRTEVTQPAMLAAGVATWRVWCAAEGPRPEVMAGHSLGEYTALVCAEAIHFADAVRLVRDRGRFMQEAVPFGTGAMAAILGLEDEQVEAVCSQARSRADGGVDTIAAVNYNAPGQVVVAGGHEAVERAIELAREAGAKRAVLLPVSVPSHCALMRPAADRLARRISDIEIRLPGIPVLHNADVATATSINTLRDALVRQLYSPVRWVESVRSMADQGCLNAIECGPGKVLTGLGKRIDKRLKTHAVHDPESLTATLAALAE